MPVESDADLRAFFDVAEFAETIQWQSSSSTKDLPAIVDAEHLALVSDATVPISTSEPQIVCRAADLPADAGQGDAVVMRGDVYAVRDMRPDGTGVMVVILEAV